MRIDPRRLPVLLAVRREGGIVAAADVLRISASAVSQQIQRLEDEVGLELIERAPTGAHLTPAGHVLADSAERIESELDETLRTLRPLTGQVTGVVEIGAFQSLITGVLVPFLTDLAHDLPGIDLRIHEVEETPGMAALRTGDLDLLALERDEHRARPPRGYVDTPLLDEPWVLITSPHAPAVLAESDLASLDWLRVTPGTAGGNAVERLTHALPSPRWSGHGYVNYAAALALVAAGAGSTVLPSLALADGVPEGVRAHPLPGLGVRHILVRHRRTHDDLATPTGQVLDRLSRWLGEHPPTWNLPQG